MKYQRPRLKMGNKNKLILNGRQKSSKMTMHEWVHVLNNIDF